MRLMDIQPTNADQLTSLLQGERSLSGGKKLKFRDLRKDDSGSHYFGVEAMSQKFEHLLVQVTGFSGFLKDAFGDAKTREARQTVLGNDYESIVTEITTVNNIPV